MGESPVDSGPVGTSSDASSAMAAGGSDGQSSQGVTPDGGGRGAGGDGSADSGGASADDAGPDVVVTVAADGGISVPPGYKGMPYGGTPQTIPGVISASQYDVGGNNVAFSYAGTVNQCAQRSTGDCIGIASFGNGQVTTTNMPEASTQSYVGWTKTGEWINYTVQVTQPGTYAIGAHLTAANTGAKVSFRFSPDVTTGPLDVPTTAGYVPGVECTTCGSDWARWPSSRCPPGSPCSRSRSRRSLV
jgi:hypothetical protein